jgi:hypothetical protein
MLIEWWRGGKPQGQWLSVQDMIADIGPGKFELLPGDKILFLESYTFAKFRAEVNAARAPKPTLRLVTKERQEP